jgi:hypothetical protein
MPLQPSLRRVNLAKVESNTIGGLLWGRAECMKDGQWELIWGTKAC